MQVTHRTRLSIAAGAFALLLSFAQMARAAVGEYPLKAAFIYNFAQFVDWPASSFGTDPKGPLVIGILGEDVFNSALERTVAGKSVAGHPLVVKHFATAEEVKPCQIIFVTAQAQDQFRAAQQKLAAASILWVGEADDFTSMGGIVRFYTEENHMRFAIRRSGADKAGLHISAKLLKLAKIVDE